MINYKQLHKDTVAQCHKYVEAFCEIMGYVEDGFMPEYYFIGSRNPDIFGVVYINDMYFNMSDLCVVIGEYDHWKAKYGDDLPKVIMEWYWWGTDYYEQDGKTPRINLQHWLMGLRPTAEQTSQEYKEQQAKELEESRQRVEEAQKELERVMNKLRG